MSFDFFRNIKASRQFRTDDKIRTKYGIAEMDAKTGMFGFGGVYNRLYEVSQASQNPASSDEQIKGSMMILKNMGINFAYHKSADGVLYLCLTVKGQSPVSAIAVLDEAEDKLKTSLYTFGIVIRRLDADERFKYIDERAPITDAGEGAGELGYMYIRHAVPENLEMLYLLLRRKENVRYIVTDYEPVSDSEVLRKMTDIYDDIPEEWTAGGTGDVASGSEYVMAGIYFAVSMNNEDTEQFFGEIKSCKCEAVMYKYRNKEAYMAFLTGNFERIKELRILPVKYALKLNPFCDVQQDGNELLETFDKLLYEEV